jgi:hypothetical protein
MTPESDPIKSNSGRTLLRTWRTYVFVLTLTGGVLMNIATLVSGAVHEYLYNGLAQVMRSVSGNFAENVLAHSTTNAARQSVINQTKKLREEKEVLAHQNRRLEAEVRDLTVKHRSAIAKIEKTALSTKDAATKVKARLTRVVARNTAAVPAESVPYLGIASTLAVTALDLYDACETLKDINKLLKDTDLPEQSTEICGQKLPTKDEVLRSVKSGWVSSVQYISREVHEQRLNMEVQSPEVKLPSFIHVRQLVCEFVSVPKLCPRPTE